MKRKLNSIISIILSAIISVTLLTGCNKQEDVVMPDILFVICFRYPDEQEYLTGDFLGTAGYYVKSNGEIRYFEFEDKEEPIFDYKQESITMNEYLNDRKINAVHTKVTENSFETDFEIVTQEKIEQCYKLSMKIDENGIVSIPNTMFSPDAVLGLSYIYSVRYNENNEPEYLMIYEYGNEYYINTDKYAEKLYAELLEVFPEISIQGFWNRNDKLS